MISIIFNFFSFRFHRDDLNVGGIEKELTKKTTVTEFFFYWVFPTETAIITALIRFDILMGSMLYSNGFVSMASKFGDAARNRKLQRKKKKKMAKIRFF